MPIEECEIIIPIWNQPGITQSCIEAIIKNTRYPYRLILIDNGSDSETKRYLKGLKRQDDPRITLLRNEANLGFVKAVNQGMRASRARFLCIMNNDTTPAPGWLERLVGFAQAHPQIGLMNPACDGDPRVSLDEHARLAEAKKGTYLEVNQCFLFATLVKREVIDKIGYLDEAFGAGCWEDADYCMRAHKAGYRCAIVYSSYVHHIHGVSFKARGDRDCLVIQGEKEFLKKWGKPPRIAAAFVLKKDGPEEEIENFLKTLLSLAREWCWINAWIFGDAPKTQARIKDAQDRLGIPTHQNIRFNFFPRAFAYPQIIARIAERSFGTKRRKRYDMILVNDRKMSSFLASTYPLHKIDIMPCNINKGNIKSAPPN